MSKLANIDSLGRVDTPTRRRFLQGGSALAVSALTASAPRPLRASRSTPQPATADRLILLWMGGGMAQTDTFDPKPYTPFSPGLDPRKVLSTFPSIPTAVDDVQFCAGLENIAGVIDRGVLMRSYVSASNIDDHAERVNHLPSQLHWHTGYRPPLTVAAPHIGSIIAKVLGPINPDVPAFIDIAAGAGGKAAAAFESYGIAGFLGGQYGPLEIPDPADAMEALRPYLDAPRFASRQKLFQRLAEASPAGQLASSYQQESMIESMENAYRLLTSPAVQALDLSLEPKQVYDRYNTGGFGLGCLLARRLVEVGARFIEVEISFENTKGWDLHADGYRQIIPMKQLIDRPIAQLILDLETRGLLDRTLVVLASEMGRVVYRLDRAPGRFADGDRIDEINDYGMNNHFAGAGSVLLFGGGMKQGLLYGKTADEFPCPWVEKPVTIEHLHATIYSALGIPPDYAFEIEGRPFYITKDAKGQPIRELLA